MANFNRKTIKNFFLFGIVAFSSFYINTIIYLFYGTRILGNFHSTLAIYIILSVIGCVGIPTSILKHSAHENTNATDSIIPATFIVIIVNCIYIPIIFFIVQYTNLLPSEIKLLLPALFLFSINKCLRSYFNGSQKMTLFYITDSLRWVQISFVISIMAFYKKDFTIFWKSFLYIELLVFSYQIYNIHFSWPKSISDVLENSKKHLYFGLKNFLGNILLIIYNKLDIIFISSILPDKHWVGLYAIAIDFSRISNYFSAFIQNKFNPIAVKSLNHSSFSSILHEMRSLYKDVKILTLLFFVLSITSFLSYSFFFLKSGDKFTVLVIFSILSIGTTCSSLFLWYGSLLTMAGFPEISYKRNIILICSSSLFYYSLISSMSIYGAALATSLAYGVRFFSLEYYSNKLLSIRFRDIRRS